MSTELSAVLQKINLRYLSDSPVSAAQSLEEMSVATAAAQLRDQPATSLIKVLPRLSTDRAADLLGAMPESLSREILGLLLPTEAARILGAMENEQREQTLNTLGPSLGPQLRTLMSYPEETAGRLMDTRLLSFRPDMTAATALERVRGSRRRSLNTLFLLDNEGHLIGQLRLQQLALAQPDTRLRDLARGVVAAVHATDPRDEVVEIAEKHQLSELPVVDLDGRMIGLIAQDRLVQALQQEAAADIGTMVGVSPQERALSAPWFAVKKRLPWLQINLLTAFLAAAVVGVFESTIAQFTALAVLLPVVAGQSGNAGAQALAVTMRGLALREVTTRQWLVVAMKEVGVGLLNGIAVAATCGLAVWVWSQSIGLVLVITSSMVLAMIAAGFAGAAVPMVLTRLGQDPAQSSSIILTTVTDIAGFSAFLGIATLLSGLL